MQDAVHKRMSMLQRGVLERTTYQEGLATVAAVCAVRHFV